MPRRKQTGCLGIIVTGAILYTVITGLLSSSESVRTSAAQTGEIREAATGVQTTSTPDAQALAPNERLMTLGEEVDLAEMRPIHGWGVVTAAVLNRRAQPSTEASIVGTLAAGACVRLTGEQDGWYRTSIEGNESWSAAEFIAVVEVCPAAVAAPVLSWRLMGI